MCEFNTKITIAQLQRLTIVSAKSKIHSPRRGCLSPGNSIVLEIVAALLFISVKNSCQFWSSLLGGIFWVFFFSRVGKSLACHAPGKWCLCA